MRGLAAAAVLLALAGPAAATPEYLLPTLFDVVEVVPDDGLNIRTAPDAGAEIIGRLASDARAVEVVAQDASGRWGQVNIAERSGWVAMRFLAYRTDVWEAGGVPPGLRCLGTEPFWSLRPEAGRLVLGTPEAGDRVMARAPVLGTGRFRDPRRVLIGTDAGGRVTAAITPAPVRTACRTAPTGSERWWWWRGRTGRGCSAGAARSSPETRGWGVIRGRCTRATPSSY